MALHFSRDGFAARIGAACRAPGGAGLDGMSGLAQAYTVCR